VSSHNLGLVLATSAEVLAPWPTTWARIVTVNRTRSVTPTIIRITHDTIVASVRKSEVGSEMRYSREFSGHVRSVLPVSAGSVRSERPTKSPGRLHPVLRPPRPPNRNLRRPASVRGASRLLRSRSLSQASAFASTYRYGCRGEAPPRCRRPMLCRRARRQRNVARCRSLCAPTSGRPSACPEV
jgi:hypothetical protein